MVLHFLKRLFKPFHIKKSPPGSGSSFNVDQTSEPTKASYSIDPDPGGSSCFDDDLLFPDELKQPKYVIKTGANLVNS